MQFDPIAGTPLVTSTPAIGSRNQANTLPVGKDAQTAPLLPGKGSGSKLDSSTERAPDPEATLRSLADAVRPANISLDFSRDEETGTVVIKLVDQASGETLKQIPSEALLRIAATLGKLQGQLFNRAA